MLRRVDWQLSTFRDSLSVPSLRGKQKSEDLKYKIVLRLERYSGFRKEWEVCWTYSYTRNILSLSLYAFFFVVKGPPGDAMDALQPRLIVRPYEDEDDDYFFSFS
jgi:hypothetical protein